MARGSFGTYRLLKEDPVDARTRVTTEMKRLGYRPHRRGGSEGRFKLVGIRGSSLVAMLVQTIPFAEVLGIGSRVRATVSGGVSLNESDNSCSLSIRVVPIRELEDREETFVLTQDLGEALGDNLQARRAFHRLVNALAESGVIKKPESTRP